MLISLFIILIIIFLVITYSVYRYVFYSPNRQQNDDYAISTAVPTQEMKEFSRQLISKINSVPFERVHTTSFDHLTLSGRLYRNGNDRPLAILFHGYRGTPSRDFCGGANCCLSMGYNVLSIEERGHCASEGHTITFGVKERYDCEAWVRFAVNLFGPDVKIVLVGISMGAATVLMASDLELPDNVKGIIADCPYSKPSSILKDGAKRLGFPVPIVFPFIRLAALIFGQFSIDGADAVSSVKKCKVPILLIHGEDDRIVPCEMSRQIAAANPEKVELHTFPDAWHGISYLLDTDRYEKLITSFCNRIFDERKILESI